MFIFPGGGIWGLHFFQDALREDMINLRKVARIGGCVVEAPIPQIEEEMDVLAPISDRP